MCGWYQAEEISDIDGEAVLNALAADVDNGFKGGSFFDKKNTRNIVLLRDISNEEQNLQIIGNSALYAIAE